MTDFYFTYILRSQKDGKNYSGFTENLKSRLELHNNGKVESTKNRRPLELIYFEACKSREDAIRREKYFKTYYGKMFIRKRLKSYFTG